MWKLTVLIALVAVAVALPAVAPGRNNPGVTRSGACSGGGTWTLKAKHDDGLIDVEFEVDQNLAGRRWSVVITRDGVRRFGGVRITRPPSGSFEVNRRFRNPAGRDRIVATARAIADRRVCRGVVSI
jgi:hypothetical protein